MRPTPPISSSRGSAPPATSRRGSASCSSTGRCSTAPPTRSTRRGARATSLIRLYADLYGIPKDDGQRKSLFNYFQGRSSLATWLRAVLAQRYVDRIRAQRRIAPLPDDERQSEAAAKPGHDRSSDPAPDPDRARHLQLLQDALGGAIADLDARDRLRLSCYYAQNLTLAETGRLLKEHEATVSRQLARTRRVIREQVERRLRDEGKLKDAQITQCFAFASEDAGPIDIEQMLVVQRTDRSAPEAAAERKEMAPDRSR